MWCLSTVSTLIVRCLLWPFASAGDVNPGNFNSSAWLVSPIFGEIDHLFCSFPPHGGFAQPAVWQCRGFHRRPWCQWSFAPALDENNFTCEYPGCYWAADTFECISTLVKTRCQGLPNKTQNSATRRGLRLANAPEVQWPSNRKALFGLSVLSCLISWLCMVILSCLVHLPNHS